MYRHGNKKAMRLPSLYCEERGFGLIEAMISVALLAIGILAIASGEIQALTMQKKSRESLAAMAMATNMVEMIRRNPALISDYGAFNTDNATSTTTSDLVRGDFAYWKQAVETSLPGGGSVNCNGKDVSKACAWVTVSPSPFPTITGGKAGQVVVQIVWPGRPNGVQVTGVISQ